MRGHLMAGRLIDELITLYSMRRVDALMEPDHVFDVVAFIRNIERDFALEAEDLLKSMELSHLIVEHKK
jgi:hypothetical protein